MIHLVYMYPLILDIRWVWFPITLSKALSMQTLISKVNSLIANCIPPSAFNEFWDRFMATIVVWFTWHLSHHSIYPPRKLQGQDLQEFSRVHNRFVTPKPLNQICWALQPFLVSHTFKATKKVISIWFITDMLCESINLVF